MSDKKVKISNILGSQIPDFIQADNPLFKEFLTQYYESEEREYGTTYLADHISSLKKISTVADISLVEKQTVNAPNSATPESPVLISSFLYLLLEEYMTVKEMKKVLERLDDSYEIVVSIGSEYQFSFEDDDVTFLGSLESVSLRFSNLASAFCIRKKS